MSVTVHLEQISQFTTNASVRGHNTLIDRPEAKGGTDRGAMGGEHLLVALGGCFMSTLLDIIRTRGVNIHDIAVEVTGTLDDVPARFTQISLQISGQAEDPELFEKYVLMAERACIVANTLKNAVELSFTIATQAEA